MCKASIAAVLLALGTVSLVQEGTNAMVIPPAGLLPTMPATETVALRRDVMSQSDIEVSASPSEPVTSRFGIEASPELVTSQPDIEASRSEPGTSHFDIEASQPVGPTSQWAGTALWP